MLQLVIKMSILNKINDALIVDIFENVFQGIASEVFLADVLKVTTLHKYVLQLSRTSQEVHVAWSSLESKNA